MKNNKVFDYIICGGGASGLYLAYNFLRDKYFKNSKILLIEKSKKNSNDRTWSFWEKNYGLFDDIIFKKWDNANFSSHNFSKDFELKPYEFKTIKGIDFYQKIITEINHSKNIEITYDEILNIKPLKKITEVSTKKIKYEGVKVFSSIQGPLKKKISFPILKQHFIGWFVKTENNIFDPKKIIFMDFDIVQKKTTRFIYVLPFKKNEALVEYTLFSKSILKNEEYEKGIKTYLKKINSGKFEIINKEKGSIPMTSYPFWENNTNNFMTIGTAGGWTKPSTGFTFFNIIKKVDNLVKHLKSKKPLNKFYKNNRFMFYDSIMIDVLYSKNEIGSEIFKRMFKMNEPKLILKFLEEKTNIYEELKIMSTFPIKIFLKSLFKKIFKKI